MNIAKLAASTLVAFACVAGASAPAFAQPLVSGADDAKAQTYGQAPLTEDSPGWDCRTMGDNVCGPTNQQGVQAGQYVNGQLVPWSAAEVPAWCRDICLGA